MGLPPGPSLRDLPCPWEGGSLPSPASAFTASCLSPFLLCPLKALTFASLSTFHSSIRDPEITIKATPQFCIL